jgi:hypothetical protein
LSQYSGDYPLRGPALLLSALPDDLQQDTRGVVRLATMLLPVTNRSDRQTDATCELFLSQPQFAANSRDQFRWYIDFCWFLFAVAIVAASASPAATLSKAVLLISVLRLNNTALVAPNDVPRHQTPVHCARGAKRR